MSLGAVVGGQVAGGADDRVAGVVDVAAGAVGRPGGRHELHRALRAGRRGAADAAGPRLDQVDGGQVAPRDAERGLGLLVGGQELLGGRGRDDLPGREGGGRACGAWPGTRGGRPRAAGSARRRCSGSRRQHVGVPLGVAAELPVGHLLGERGGGQLDLGAGRGPGSWSRRPRSARPGRRDRPPAGRWPRARTRRPARWWSWSGRRWWSWCSVPPWSMWWSAPRWCWWPVRRPSERVSSHVAAVSTATATTAATTAAGDRRRIRPSRLRAGPAGPTVGSSGEGAGAVDGGWRRCRGRTRSPAGGRAPRPGVPSAMTRAELEGDHLVAERRRAAACRARSRGSTRR